MDILLYKCLSLLLIIIMEVSIKTEFTVWESVLLRGFSTLGSTGPIEKLKGGHEGEKQGTKYF